MTPVVVTGLDNIKVDPAVLKKYRDILDNKNVGLITTFEDRENSEVNIDTMNAFTNTLVAQDLIILGGVTSNTLPIINESFGNAVIDTHLIL